MLFLSSSALFKNVLPIGHENKIFWKTRRKLGEKLKQGKENLERKAMKSSET